MRQQSRELLAVQLREALDAHQGDPSASFEVAVLAGLLSRYRGAGAGLAESALPLLTRARKLSESGALDPAQPIEEVAAEMLNRVFSLAEDDSEAERADALLDLDELCAGCCFLGSAERCVAASGDVAGAIRAFPHLWQKLAPWASRILAEAPPLSGDPAIWVWQAVEYCLLVPEALTPPACDSARRELGIPLLVSRSTVTAQRPALYAASALPPPAVLQSLERRAGFELGLATGPDGQPVLVVSCATLPEIICNGTAVALQKLGSVLYSAPAKSGEYLLRVGAEAVPFEVTD